MSSCYDVTGRFAMSCRRARRAATWSALYKSLGTPDHAGHWCTLAASQLFGRELLAGD